jgi:hypothetical protein
MPKECATIPREDEKKKSGLLGKQDAEGELDKE